VSEHLLLQTGGERLVVKLCPYIQCGVAIIIIIIPIVNFESDNK